MGKRHVQYEQRVDNRTRYSGALFIRQVSFVCSALINKTLFPQCHKVCLQIVLNRLQAHVGVLLMVCFAFLVLFALVAPSCCPPCVFISQMLINISLCITIAPYYSPTCEIKVIQV